MQLSKRIYHFSKILSSPFLMAYIYNCIIDLVSVYFSADDDSDGLVNEDCAKPYDSMYCLKAYVDFYLCMSPVLLPQLTCFN